MLIFRACQLHTARATRDLALVQVHVANIYGTYNVSVVIILRTLVANVLFFMADKVFTAGTMCVLLTHVFVTDITFAMVCSVTSAAVAIWAVMLHQISNRLAAGITRNGIVAMVFSITEPAFTRECSSAL